MTMTDALYLLCETSQSPVICPCPAGRLKRFCELERSDIHTTSAQHDCLDGVIDIRTSLSAHIHKDGFENEKANSIKFIATYLLQESNSLVQSTTICLKLQSITRGLSCFTRTVDQSQAQPITRRLSSTTVLHLMDVSLTVA